MSRICTCDKFSADAKSGLPWQTEWGCKLCWLYHNDERYRAHWDKASVPPKPPPAPRPLCKRLGPEVREEGCKTCRGSTRIKVFDCEIHGACSIGRDVGVAVCAKCPDYQGVES